MTRSVPPPLLGTRKPNRWLLWGGIAAGVLAVGAGAIYFWFARRGTQDDGVMGIATVVPQSAQVVMAFNADSEPWEKLRQFGTPESQKLLNEAMAKSPLNTLLVQGKMEFQRDVRPWLGSSVLTALVRDPGQANRPPDTLVLAPTRDREQSAAFLDRYRAALGQQGATFELKQYEGVPYYEAPTRETGTSVVTAEIGGRYVAIATSAAVVQQAIDVYQKEKPALAQKESFVRALSRDRQPIPNLLLQVYLDGSVALEAISAQTRINITPPLIEQSRQELDAMTIAIGTQKEGLRLAVDSLLKTPRSSPAPVTAGTVLARLPQETFFAISGLNLKNSWQSLTAQAKANPSSTQFVEQVRKGVRDSMGVDLDKDVLDWMTGEFAIAAVPVEKGFLANAGFGLVAMVETNAPSAANKFMQRLDDLAAKSSNGLLPQGVAVAASQQAGTPVTAWKVGEAIAASHGVLDNKLVFWMTGDLGAELLPKPANTLPSSSTFGILTANLPKENGGYFYFNMTAALAIADKLIPPEAKTNPSFVQVMTVLDAIRGITATTTAIDDRTNRIDLLFTLKPTPGN